MPPRNNLALKFNPLSGRRAGPCGRAATRAYGTATSPFDWLRAQSFSWGAGPTFVPTVQTDL